MKVRPELLIACLLAFLAPVIGGHVAVDAQPQTMGIWPAILSGSALPLGTRALLALLCFGGLGYLFATRRVFVLPHPRIWGLTLLLLAFLALSILLARSPYGSVSAWLTWATMGAGLFFIVAAAGRGKGPWAIAACLAGGCLAVALKGILEYGEMRALDPNHRIFADYNNPNAAAGILLLGVPLGLALATGGSLGRRVFGWAAGALCLSGLLLTQSKGGFLSLGVALIALAVLTGLWGGWRKVAAIPTVAVAAVLLVMALQRTAPTPTPVVPAAPVVPAVAAQAQALAPESGPGPLARLSRGQETQEQSMGFRKLLWQSSVALIKSNPIGHGVGSFPVVSSQPGLVPPTNMAHQTPLQVAAEGGVLAGLTLLALLGVWLFEVCKGARWLPADRNLLRAGIVAAILGVGAHGLVESNLYFLGIGMTTFMLLGLGLAVAVDGCSPELLRPQIRAALIFGACASPLGVAIYFAHGEALKASALSSVLAHEPAAAQAALERARSIHPADGETWYLSGRFAQDLAERTLYLDRAAQRAPSPRYYRTLARAQAERGLAQGALASLAKALELDPNSLPTLLMYMEIYDKSGDWPSAEGAARRIIDVESKSYLQVRALPDFVPTEPYEARIYLAGRTSDPAERAKLLRAAVDGFLTYRTRTVPQVTAFSREGLDYLGENRETAGAKMAMARKACADLLTLYSDSGDEAGKTSVTEILGVFSVPED